jgi:hypothetical protein
MLSKREIKKIVEECKKEVNSAEGFNALNMIGGNIDRLSKDQIENWIIGLTKFSILYMSRLTTKEISKTKKKRIN